MLQIHLLLDMIKLLNINTNTSLAEVLRLKIPDFAPFCTSAASSSSSSTKAENSSYS
jgi:hypothetical protein